MGRSFCAKCDDSTTQVPLGVLLGTHDNMRLAIYLNLAAGDARALYRALLEQLSTRHPDWELPYADWRFLANPLRQNADFSAYIGCHLPPDDLKFLVARGIPCVFIGSPPTGLSLPPRVEIDFDNPAFGRQAARLLIDRGWTSFAFVGDESIPDSQGRLAGLREGLMAIGVEPAVFDDGAGVPLDLLIRWLASLPPATAILARSDHAALRVVAAARGAGLHFPGRLGLLGIDDEDLARSIARLDFASLRRDDIRIAALAFDLLDLQLTGEFVSPGVRRVGPHPHPYLGSTIDLPRAQSPVLRRSLAALGELPVHQLDPNAIATAAGCSRRTLERTFAREWHESPAEAVRRVRMEHARRLCQSEDWPLTRIARTLGFNATGNFIAAYRRFWGVPPRQSRTKLPGVSR